MDGEVVQGEVVEAGQPADRSTGTSNEIVQSTGTEPAEAMLWRHFHKLGGLIAATAFVPDSFRDKTTGLIKANDVMAAIAYGHEIGLGPMQAVQSFDVIKGKPTLKPETMRALIRAAGHSLVRIEATAERVTFKGRRADTGDEETVTYTWDDAKAMGLTGKDNWKNQPRAMLTARCTGEIGRSLFSDVLMGASYTPEELGDDGAEPDMFTDGPLDYEPRREPPVRIVQSDPRHAGRVVTGANVRIANVPVVSEFSTPAENAAELERAAAPAPSPRTIVRGDYPPDDGGATNDEIATMPDIALCAGCGHPTDDHGGLGASAGCTKCACKNTFALTRIVAAGSPDRGEGEAAPVEVQAAPPPPEFPTADQPIPPGQATVGTQAGSDDAGHPTLVSSEPPAPLANPVSEGKFRHIHAVMKENGLGDEERHCIVAFVTGSRTTSSREVTADEADVILNLLGQVRLARLSVEVYDGKMGILSMNDAGTKFLKSIERTISPARGRSGVEREAEGDVGVEPLTDDEMQGAI